MAVLFLWIPISIWYCHYFCFCHSDISLCFPPPLFPSLFPFFPSSFHSFLRSVNYASLSVCTLLLLRVCEVRTPSSHRHLFPHLLCIAKYMRGRKPGLFCCGVGADHQHAMAPPFPHPWFFPIPKLGFPNTLLGGLLCCVSPDVCCLKPRNLVDNISY